MGACLSTGAASGGGGTDDSALTNHQMAEKTMKDAKKKLSNSSRILLLGSGDSGKSTVLKQMRIINSVPFTQQELDMYKAQIFRNLVTGMKVLLDALKEISADPEAVPYYSPVSSSSYNSANPLLQSSSSTATSSPMKQAPTKKGTKPRSDSTSTFETQFTITSPTPTSTTITVPPSSFPQSSPSNTIRRKYPSISIPNARQPRYTTRHAELHARLDKAPHLKDGDPFPTEYYEILSELWDGRSDGDEDLSADVRECVELGVGFALPDNLEYFFSQLSRLFNPSYVPSNQDVVCCRIRTTGISETIFTMRKSRPTPTPAAPASLSQYAPATPPPRVAPPSSLNVPTLHVIDVGGQKSERRKWISQFEDVTAVLFMVSLSGYNQCLVEDIHANQMQDAMTIWDGICSSQWFRYTSIILFLNKEDLFKSRLPRHPIKDTFPDYSGDPNDVEAGKDYFLRRFLRLAAKGTRTNRATAKGAATGGTGIAPPPKKGKTGFVGDLRRSIVEDSDPESKMKERGIYPHFTTATDTSQLRVVMNAVQDIVLRDNFSKTHIV